MALRIEYFVGLKTVQSLKSKLVMRMLSNLVICCGLCLPLLGAEDITIRGANTDNPTLLYKQKPMLKAGPISEDRVFMYAIGSDFFDHKAWFDYMAESGFGFARVDPAHTWHEDQRDKSTKPLHPYENSIIKKTPPVTRKVALCSALETIVYLHKGFEQRQEAGAELELGDLSMPDGSVSVRFE